MVSPSAHAVAFHEMEGPLEDLRCATVLLEILHLDVMVESKARPGIDGFTTYCLTNDQRDALSYAVVLVRDLARKLASDHHQALREVRS